MTGVPRILGPTLTDNPQLLGTSSPSSSFGGADSLAPTVNR
ncbi:MAG: hypothetical protein ACKOD2_08150 [Ilumatobacteraceae bacterium]